MKNDCSRPRVAAGTRRRIRASAPVLVALVLLLGLAPVRPAAALDAARPVEDLLERRWTTAAGLPQNGILSLAQSSDGFLWIGTQEGLARFDGIEFRIFDRGSLAVLEDQFITALAAGEEALWVGTRDGLVRMGHGGFERIGVGQDDLPNTYVRSLRVAADGSVWIGTYGSGLVRLSSGDGAIAFDERHGLRDPFVRALALTADGTVWAGTSRGLARLDERGLRMVDDSTGPGERLVRCLLVDGRGRLWVGTEGGGLFRGDGASFERLGPDSITTVNALTEDADGNVWLAADQNLLARIDLEDRLEPREVVGVNALLGDAEGSIWLGTNTGLVQLKDRRVRVVGGGAEEARSVRTVHEGRSGRVWLGSDGGGVEELVEGSLNRPLALAPLATESVRAVTEDEAGHLWIGTRNGLHKLAGSGLQSFGLADGLPDLVINALTPSRDGRIWVGTAAGLVAWDGRRFATPEHFSEPAFADARVRSLLTEASGRLWVGTESGLVTREARLLDREGGLASDFVLSLHLDDRDGLWIGTSAGLSLLRGDEVVSFREAQGVPQRAIYEILEDGEGNLWLCSSRGIHRISLAELIAVAGGRLTRVHSVTLTEEDGLVSSQCNGGTQPAGWRTGDGRLLFPTQRGLAIVETERLRSRTVPPRAVLDEVRVANEPVAYGASLVLGPEKPSLEIDYTAPTFLSPRSVRFRYRVDGLDDEWLYVGSRRRAYFSGLRPGSYRFRVSAANEEGRWDDIGAELDFMVQPSLLERIWVRVALLLLLLGVLGTLYGLRMRQVRRRERLLESLVEERTEQLQHANEVLAGLASTDALTGITNYRRFQELLQEEWRRSVRGGRCLALILLDIDYFKGFNDTYGHAAGDSCLRRVAGALERLVSRPGDVVARYGGEEFAALLPETDGRGALLMAERFRRGVLGLGIENSSSGVASVVTLSAGVAALVPAPDQEPSVLFELADNALYEAKRAGRNRVIASEGETKSRSIAEPADDED